MHDYDRWLIEPWEQQADDAAAVERELDALEQLPLNELLELLSTDQRKEADRNTREYIIDTFGTELAEHRLED